MRPIMYLPVKNGQKQNGPDTSGPPQTRAFPPDWSIVQSALRLSLAVYWIKSARSSSFFYSIVDELLFFFPAPNGARPPSQIEWCAHTFLVVFFLSLDEHVEKAFFPAERTKEEANKGPVFFFLGLWVNGLVVKSGRKSFGCWLFYFFVCAIVNSRRNL